jgi:hypothetical protein
LWFIAVSSMTSFSTKAKVWSAQAFGEQGSVHITDSACPEGTSFRDRTRRRLELRPAPYYPVWSIIAIAVAVVVILALTAYGRDITYS